MSRVQGCPGGESVEEMCTRVDALVKRIETMHEEYINRCTRNEVEDGAAGADVLIIRSVLH